MKIDPVDDTEQISESSLDCAATGHSEAATAEPSREPGFIIGFFNSSMRAQTHLARRDISPQEAALLLSGLVPRRRADSDELDQPSENGLRPEVYSNLISKFVETAKDGKCRDLRDWLKIAQESGLKHSTWLKLYLEAAKQLDILVGPSDNGNAAEAIGPEIINSPPAQCVSGARAISKATAIAVSSPTVTVNVLVDLGQRVALAAEQRRITADSNRQVAGDDMDAEGAEPAQPDDQSVCGLPEKYEQPAPSGTPKKQKRVRSTDITALLNRCVADRIAPHIADVWLHITSNAGKIGFPIATASTDSASRVNGGKVTKQQLKRALETFRKNNLSTT